MALHSVVVFGLSFEFLFKLQWPCCESDDCPVTLKYVRQILYLAPTVWEFSVSHSTIDINLAYYLKFIYSEKATKFCEISTADLTVTI